MAHPPPLSVLAARAHRVSRGWWLLAVVCAGVLSAMIIIAVMVEAGQDPPWGLIVRHSTPSPPRTPPAHSWPGAN